MVDSTRGPGPLQGPLPSARTQGTGVIKRGEKAEGPGAIEDRVEISQVALDQQQAESAAADVRNVLEQFYDITLGYNPDQLDRKA